MASDATISTDITEAAALETRPQAGPLPQKRGEIGYRESAHQPLENVESTDSQIVLPARHPADREPEAPAGAPTATEAPPPPNPPATSDVSSTHKNRKHKLLSIFNVSRKFTKTAIGGIRIPTLLRFVLQLVILGGTIASWILLIRRLGDQANTLANDGVMAFGGSGTIFVHIAFGIATLGQLLFLERCVFYMRAQRYCHQNPGALLPTSGRNRSQMGAGMAFAPWNRPSLPTYAAALAQSGHGTGDVEDSAIAIPPPPAYGNTRGSTLLLAGFIRNSLRRDFSMDDIESQADHRASQTRERSRPVSYISQDAEWEQRCDAERALRLAESLARLEEGSSSSRLPSSSTR